MRPGDDTETAKKTLNRRTRRPVGSDGENLRIGLDAVKRPPSKSPLFAQKSSRR
jgi:hypothetical protein